MRVDAYARSLLHGCDDDLDWIGAHEVYELAQVALRLRIREGLGPDTLLPTMPNTWVTHVGRDILWLGPDEWLVVGDPGTANEIVRWLEGSFAALDRSVIDVSASRAVIDLGPGSTHRLDQGCALDLHPRTWRAGMCAQTLLAHIPVILQAREGETRVFVRQSFACSLVDWLLVVAGP